MAAEELITTVPDSPQGAATESAQPISDLGIAETLRVLATVVAPTLAIGVIKRRPRWMGFVDRLHLDRAAITTMRRLRARHGAGPVNLRLPGRSIELPLSAEDAGRVLAGTPDPFTPATTEKRAALRHFQPHAVLISRGTKRTERRAFNDAVLQPDRPLHTLAPRVVAVVREETHELLDATESARLVDWDDFAPQWWAAVRRIVLGDAAREDDQLTDLLGTLRRAGNWASLHPLRGRARQRFLRGVAEYTDRAEPGSLAAEVANTPAAEGVDPAGQIPHWLFAFDAAGLVTFRTMALLAGHPEEAHTAGDELANTDLTTPQQLPYLRACVLESVRLWPTTPALLRESTRATGWGPAGTTSFIYTPFFHRDNESLPYADAFAPHIWLDGTARSNPALVPFSAGPGQCPGRHLVLLTASTLLATVLEHHDLNPTNTPALPAGHPLPASLNHFTTRVGIRSRSDIGHPADSVPVTIAVRRTRGPVLVGI